MRLRGREWPSVFNASGARGFYGEGYWWHRLLRPLGLDWTGCGFVAKTTTVAARRGNMPFDPVTLRPSRLKPDCIVVKPFKGVVLNAVGLSGPGAPRALLSLQDAMRSGALDRAFASFMPVAESSQGRIAEAEGFAVLLAGLVREVGMDRVGLQVNFSCPNTASRPLLSEMDGILSCFRGVSTLGVPVLAKLSAVTPVLDAVNAAMGCRDCDGLVVSNTIPWGKLSERIDWNGLFNLGMGEDAAAVIDRSWRGDYTLSTRLSPLARFGGGGLSGAPLLPIVRDWVRTARHLGLEKPVVAGGGILSKADAVSLLGAGADAVELGSIAILRPWRVRGVVRRALARAEGR